MIELSSLFIRNFKSLGDLPVGFEIEFQKFTCLIGLNGSGKSTILHSLDFISELMNGDITNWLKNRTWNKNELNSKLLNEEEILASLIFFHNNNLYTWGFVFDTNLKKCIREEVLLIKDLKNIHHTKTIFEVKDSKFNIEEKNFSGNIIQEYEGSFISSIKEEFLPKPIAELKKYLQNIYSLDLLSPRELKKPSKIGSKLGLSGENLSSYLSTLTKEQKDIVLSQLKNCYPNLDDFNIIKSEDGWNKLELTEIFNGKKIINESKYLNDGILRLIAILAQLQTSKSFLLFDEIENGINPELIEFLVDILIKSDHQVIITTHSPMVLNYIEDEIAQESVHYIYRTEEGFTKSIPFFEIPSMKEKLEFMGAGEVYVDTNLTKLYDEIKTIKTDKEEKE